MLRSHLHVNRPPNHPAFGVKFPLFCCFYAITIFYLIIPLNWHFHYHTYIAQFHRDIDIRNTIETFSFAILYVLHWCMSGARAPVLHNMHAIYAHTPRPQISTLSCVYRARDQWPRWSTTQFYQAASLPSSTRAHRKITKDFMGVYAEFMLPAGYISIGFSWI